MEELDESLSSSSATPLTSSSSPSVETSSKQETNGTLKLAYSLGYLNACLLMVGVYYLTSCQNGMELAEDVDMRLVPLLAEKRGLAWLNHATQQQPKNDDLLHAIKLTGKFNFLSSTLRKYNEREVSRVLYLYESRESASAFN